MIGIGTGPESRSRVAVAVFEILSSVLLMEPSLLSESQQLFSELQVESIDILDILTHLESSFGVPSGLEFPFLDRSFFDDGAENFMRGKLTASGRKSLAKCGFLNELLLEGSEAEAYLLSIACLIDLAHGWAQSTHSVALDLEKGSS